MADINAILTEVLQAEPALLQVVGAVKVIWSRANPASTDADWGKFLAEASAKTTSDADQDLIKLGYTRDPVTGVWSKPPAPPV